MSAKGIFIFSFGMMLAGCSPQAVLIGTAGNLVEPYLKQESQETFFVKTYDAFYRDAKQTEFGIQLSKEGRRNLETMVSLVVNDVYDRFKGELTTLSTIGPTTTTNEPKTVTLEFKDDMHSMAYMTDEHRLVISSNVAKALFDGAIMDVHIGAARRGGKELDKTLSEARSRAFAQVKDLRDELGQMSSVPGINNLQRIEKFIREEPGWLTPFALFIPAIGHVEARALHDIITDYNRSFMYAIEFLIAHELAHAFLGHAHDVALFEKKSLSCDRRKELEIEADSVAVLVLATSLNRKRINEDDRWIRDAALALASFYSLGAIDFDVDDKYRAHRGHQAFFRYVYDLAGFTDDPAACYPAAKERGVWANYLASEWLLLMPLANDLRRRGKRLTPGQVQQIHVEFNNHRARHPVLPRLADAFVSITGTDTQTSKGTK